MPSALPRSPKAHSLPHRKINSPYKGTLSSYGYVLLVIYFLVHVKNPPVLPNLQQMPPLRPISKVSLYNVMSRVAADLKGIRRRHMLMDIILGMQEQEHPGNR
jgi:hypothetical protein